MCAVAQPHYRVDQMPALQSELYAAAHRKFGIVGAKAALVGMRPDRILTALKGVLLEADEMPLYKVAGPWAQEVPFNHGSYLFNFGSLTEGTVQDWIEMAKGLGFTQINNHGGSDAFFRFGDFELNREKWPEGWEGYRRIVARLHSAGIGSIFHTYAFFINKHSKYVTPIPDKRLDAFRAFTLAGDVDADAGSIPVNEPTTGMSTVTGFFEQNSVVLHLGDELVTFGGMSREPPWRFTGVKRGVLGTKAAPHEKGVTARHLKECFGLFVPNPESSLFTEIAANHAEVVNHCGFDGIYLDAIDGSSILRGGDESWYWADKFVMEIQKRLEKPVGMEMSAMWHHFWQYPDAMAGLGLSPARPPALCRYPCRGGQRGPASAPPPRLVELPVLQPAAGRADLPRRHRVPRSQARRLGCRHLADRRGGPRAAPNGPPVSPGCGHASGLRGNPPCRDLG